jgi:hypothetical protein
MPTFPGPVAKPSPVQSQIDTLRTQIARAEQLVADTQQAVENGFVGRFLRPNPVPGFRNPPSANQLEARAAAQAQLDALNAVLEDLLKIGAVDNDGNQGGANAPGEVNMMDLWATDP